MGQCDGHSVCMRYWIKARKRKGGIEAPKNKDGAGFHYDNSHPTTTHGVFTLNLKLITPKLLASALAFEKHTCQHKHRVHRHIRIPNLRCARVDAMHPRHRSGCLHVWH